MGNLTDVLIIGQGISGTFLSRELERAGLSHIIIDAIRPHTASRAAAGLINPVTGRRLVTTWMIDELLPFVIDAYNQWEPLLGSTFMDRVKVIDFFPTAQMRVAFTKRIEEGAPYLTLPADEQQWASAFHYELGYGIIEPCFLIDMPGLIAAARERLQRQGLLREEDFELEALEVKHGQVSYKDIQAKRVIFCDGMASFANPWFTRLPFAPNKGEALILEIPDWPQDRGHVFKKGISIAPWKDGLCWVGSSYEWAFDHPHPTEAFRQRTEAVLLSWLKLPFRIIGHIAAVRPATLERRPFVGLHPANPEVGILNGMGTKGCSLAPYFARQLADHLAKGWPIRPDADIRRFTKVLSKT